MSERNFFSELKRRNVYKVAVAYIVGGWALSQGIAQVFPVFDVPNWVIRLIVLLIIIGLPIALVLAWMFEITPQGIKRTATADAMRAGPGQKKRAWIYVVAVGGLLSIGLFFLGRYSAESRTAQQAESRMTLPEKSIAVLPFVNMSANTANDYFSDGITEEILNALAQIPNLKVAARTSAFAFKGKGEDLRKVGEVLDVATVLEGSVQRAGDDVRITAQLIDARTGYHLWSEKYDRKLTSIFAVEDEISKTIADKLQVQLGGGQPLVATNTQNPQAHDLYLRGLSLLAARGPGLRDAVAVFKQAVATDPEYGQAWAGLSLAYELLPYYTDSNHVVLGEWFSSLDQAEAAARRALALAPQSAESHLAMANILRDRLKFAAADQEYTKALALNPGLAETYDQYAEMLGAVGRFRDAVARARTAVSLNPVSAHPHFVLGWLLACVRHEDEAIVELRKALDIWPGFALARFPLASVYIEQGNYKVASMQASMGAQEAGEDPALVQRLVAAVADPAERADALERIDRGGTAGRYLLFGLANAYWYALLGAHEKAISSLQHWADSTTEADWVTFPSLSLAAFNPIRSDPRFKAAVLKKTGLPPAPLAEATRK
jgi:adenylate cyclase